MTIVVWYITNLALLFLGAFAVLTVAFVIYPRENGVQLVVTAF